MLGPRPVPGPAFVFGLGPQQQREPCLDALLHRLGVFLLVEDPGAVEIVGPVQDVTYCDVRAKFHAQPGRLFGTGKGAADQVVPRAVAEQERRERQSRAALGLQRLVRRPFGQLQDQLGGPDCIGEVACVARGYGLVHHDDGSHRRVVSGLIQRASQRGGPGC